MLRDNSSPTRASTASATSFSTPSPTVVTDAHHHQHDLLSQPHGHYPAPPLDRKPQQLRPHHVDPLHCPRCESINTKFCYYNNYSLSQPRYFCKTCRRYWTKGGSLRNVPVGGGCRKGRRGAGGQTGTKNSNKLTGAVGGAPLDAAGTGGEYYGHRLTFPLLPFSHHFPTAAAHTQAAALGAQLAAAGHAGAFIGFASGGSGATDMQLSSETAAFSALFPHLSLVGAGGPSTAQQQQLVNFKECNYEQHPISYRVPFNQQLQHLGCNGDVLPTMTPPVTRGAQLSPCEVINPVNASAESDMSGINIFGAFRDIDGFSSGICDSGIDRGNIDYFQRHQKPSLPWTLDGSLADNESDVLEVKPAVGKLLSLEWQPDQQSGCADVVGAGQQIGGSFASLSSDAAAGVRMWGEMHNVHSGHWSASDRLV